MIRLLRVELSRLLHRRAVLLLVAACIAIPVVIGVAIVLNTRPPSAGDIARAEQEVAAQREAEWVQDELERCKEDPTDYGVGVEVEIPEGEEYQVPQTCEEAVLPRLEEYLYYDELDLAEERDQGSGVAVALILAIVMFLIGTTFTGHDWASGSVSNQLLFEPRRIRVWLAKALVVTGAALALAAVVFTSYWLSLGAVADSRDLLRQGLLLDSLQMGWRGAVIAGAAALVGFALTTLFRSTVATLGILFAVSLAGGILLGMLGFEGRWHPAFNLAAVLFDGTTYWAEVACPPGEMGGYCTADRTLTVAHGASYVGIVVAAACAISVASFRRRDVP